MAPRLRLLALPLSLWFLTGCVAPVLSPVPTRPNSNAGNLLGSGGGNVIAAGGGNAIAPAAGVIAAGGGNVIAAGGGNVISLDAAGLIGQAGTNMVGTVKAPPGLIGQAGTNLIGQAGTNLIGQAGTNLIGQAGTNLVAGGQRHVAAAAEEVPVAGRRVYLMDAAGRVVVDANGAPIAAETDAEGRYRFEGLATTRHVLVVVPFAEGQGQLVAVATKGSTEVGIGLVSTLATTYIRERYVKGQADPAATLDKLPAEIERETRERTAAALAAESSVMPQALTPEKLLASVESLRQRNAALDAQLETVKKLLIAAGQSDLGAGRIASEVALAGVRMLLAGPDGSLCMAASGDHRVWRLDPDGRLRTLVGSGTPDQDHWSDRPAPEAPLMGPSGISLDGQGRLVILETRGDYGDRLSRLEADGRVRELARLGHTPLAVANGEDAWLAQHDGGWKLVRLKADGTREAVMSLTGDDADAFIKARLYGRDAQGRIYVAAGEADLPLGQVMAGIKFAPPHTLFRIDPAAKQISKLLTVGVDGIKGLSVDAAGNAFYLDAAGALKLLKPDGTRLTVAARLPEGFGLALDPVALMPDGSAYVAQRGTQVHRFINGAATRVAGVPASNAGQAEALALQAPAGVTTAGGELIVVDELSHRLTRIKPDGSSAPFAGTGTAGDSGDGGPATEARLNRPTAVHADGAGNVYVLDQRWGAERRLRRIGANGTIETVYKTERSILDFAVMADGTLLFSDWHQPSESQRLASLRRLTPGGTIETLLDFPSGLNNQYFAALSADGALVLWDGQRFATWKSGQTAVSAVEVPEALKDLSPSGLAVGPDGRWYVSGANQDRVMRFDPASRAVAIVAGAGGRFFAGSGVDQGLLDPGALAFGRDGSLYLADSGHKQVKRIAAVELVGW